jgi:Uma2 family endonuclease
MAKVQDWLEAGCREVWVVDPKTQTVAVHRSRNEVLVLHSRDALGGGDLLPGFNLPLAKIVAI